MRNRFFIGTAFCLIIISCNKKEGGFFSGRSYAERYIYLDSTGITSDGDKWIDSLDRLNSDKFSNQQNLQIALAALHYSRAKYDVDHVKEEFLTAAVQKTKEKNWNKLYATAIQDLANYTWVAIADKNKALQFYNLAYLGYNNYSPEEFPGKYLCLAEYAAAYYSFEQYDRAIMFFNEAVKLGDYKTDQGLYISGWNTLGLCYRAKGEYKKAIDIFNEVLAYAVKNNNKAWTTIIRGNIGTVYHFQNKPEAARPLLEDEVLRGTTRNDWKSAASAQLYLSEIELNAGNVAIAKEGFHKAREYSLKSPLTKNSKTIKRLFDDMATVYRNSGDFRGALLYMDSARIVNDSIQKKFGANVLLSAQNQIDQVVFNEKKKATARINGYTRNMLIAGIVLLAIGSVVLIRRQRLKHLRKQKKIQTENEQIAKELNAATAELDLFARSLEEKNSIIERIAQLQTEKKDAEDKYDILAKLEKSVLLTDEQWNEFTGLFEKVHGSFLQRLKDKWPSISPAEVRIIALGKLKLSNKTMAGMLGITPDAVRMNKFRIRKKLNLEEEAEFERFLQTI